MIRRGVVLLVIAGLGGCGGGGGGGAGPGSAEGPGVIGARGMPDGVVTVRAPGPSGASRVLWIDLPADYPAIAAVEVGVAIGPGQPAQVASASSEGPGRWRVEVTPPTPLPEGARAFVRLRHVDGAVVESGNDDYPLR